MSSAQLTYIGHATVGIHLDGIRILTDPLLRPRVAHLYRYGPAPDPVWLQPPDAVLLSHLHLDHCDVPSLRQLGTTTRLIAPRGAGLLLRRRGFQTIEELGPGDTTSVGSLSVSATLAAHSGFRPPAGPTALALGFLITGSRRLYFAGDTDLFPEMAELGAGLDVALLPVWGWGRTLGPGHLDPRRAAEALRLLRPLQAVPIHWGTYARVGLVGRMPDFLTEPPHLFKREAALLAPDVAIRIVLPGGEISL
jgi:L-ascorbate metabolism protein UlaG (beta-lactamase superfamily)